MTTDSIKQDLINALNEADALASGLAHTFIRNIAHDEFDRDDANLLIEGINNLSQLASDVRKCLRKLLESGELD